MQLRQYITILLIPFICLGCTSIDNSFDLQSSESSDVSSSDDLQDVSEWMDNYLSYYYLYNDEYNTVDRDLTLSYDTFLSTTLKKMETNVLDYKDGSIYSWIGRSASTKAEAQGDAKTKSSITKQLELTFGLVSSKIVSAGGGQYVICVNAVAVDSPLYRAGVRRGDIIVAVGGAYFSLSSVSGYSQLLLNPTSESTLSLTLYGKSESVSVTSEYMYCSPILHYDIYDESVGYLSYLSFDIAYDDELLSVMSYFKSAGITDLILDLRLNTGGYIATANKLSTAIVGSASSGRVFVNYQFNQTLASKLSQSYKVEYFLSTLSSYHLNLSRLYCLVSGQTASASELVINSLEGVDVEVVLIGSQTEGKNVGMLVFEDTFDGWDYEFYPVTMSLSNDKGFGEYEDGFVPDYELDDWGGGSNYADFSASEVLIAKALDLISPVSRVTAQSEGREYSAGLRGDMKIESENVVPNNRIKGNISSLEL